MAEIDWNALRDTANAAVKKAYAPYSKFPVGAAALTDGGQVVTGSNVENVSYGLGVCAEVAVAADLARAGGGRLVALSVAGGNGQILMPCGRCRQVLFEFGGAELIVDHRDGPRPLSSLLPDAFGPSDLAGGAL